MRKWRTGAAAILAALGVATSATAQVEDRARAAFERDFCWGLKRLVREAPDFEGIWNAHPAPPGLGFRPGACRPMGKAAGKRAWHCHQQIAPDFLGFESLAAATAACLPEARRQAAEGSYRRQAVFTLPGLTLRMWESGGPRAKVGRVSTYRVEEAAPAKE